MNNPIIFLITLTSCHPSPTPEELANQAILQFNSVSPQNPIEIIPLQTPNPNLSNLIYNLGHELRHLHLHTHWR